MKYGERLEEASVPGWSLHNVDYNSLKHQIRAHTTKDQAATAITIPGQKDHGLQRFEDAFYLELCSQHSRVNLFVNSKTDEIARRLRHLSSLVHQLMLKCADARGFSAKRQQRFVKYHMQIEECHQDIKALVRFVNAQVTAFRKILKKYKKWTGSTSLTGRFKENVLANPKSLTHRDFTHLQLQYEELRTTLEAAGCSVDENLPHTSPDYDQQSVSSSRRGSQRPSRSAAPPPPVQTYWNEYEHGSEAGDYDEGYVIYIDPNASDDFPGISYIKGFFGAPVDRLRHWLHSRDSDQSSSTLLPSETMSNASENQSLLGRRQRRKNKGNNDSTASSPIDYFSIGRPATGITTDNDATEDEGLSSEEDRPRYQQGGVGYEHESSYADYKLHVYRDKMLTRAVIVAFLVSFVLVGVSGLLIATGRHRFRVEVDAGAATCSVLSLFCACMGLGAMIYRQYASGYLYSLTIAAAFVAACVLNGMVLILVVGSSGI